MVSTRLSRAWSRRRGSQESELISTIGTDLLAPYSLACSKRPNLRFELTTTKEPHYRSG
jgi:hypothetical protein